MEHLQDPESRDHFQKLLLNTHADPVWNRLRRILELEAEALERKELTPKQYEHAAWPYLQAHRNGQRQAIQLLQDLLKLE